MVAVVAFLSGSAAGLLAGMVGARFAHELAFGLHGGPRWGEARPPGALGGPPPAALRRLERMLHLTPAQSESIATVLDRSRNRFDALSDSLRAQIEAQLTPAQRVEWRALHEQFHHHGPWSHGHGS